GLTTAARAGDDPAKALAAVDRAVEAADLDYLATELRDSVDQTLVGVERVASIVRAMKEFSHPGTTIKTPTDINAAISATITVATNEWKYVATVETDFDEQLPLVPCLPGDFNQVILNIVVNAAHAIGVANEERRDSEKGTIRVRTRRVGEQAVISISDTGTGIPERLLNKIFDPFFTTKDVGIGTGQGLAISRSVVVDKHGGTLEVDSTPGQGATFTIGIPLAAPLTTGGLG
ncbi:MAG: ATP-binding protein, partial [Planctomycetota bacterium]